MILKKEGGSNMNKKMKGLLSFKYADELTKSAFIIVTTLLLTAPLLDSVLISLAIAETFCALAFMPDLDDDVKNAKKVNFVFNYIVPVVMLLFIIIFNFENIKMILISSIISFIIALLTIRSESVFHSIGMFLLPIAQFVAIEGSRGNLETLFGVFKNPVNKEHIVPLFVLYITAVGIIYALYNITFLIFKNKKIVFSVFGIISVIISVVNAISIVFLNKLFAFSLIGDLINIFKTTIDWTVYFNSSTLFNASVVSAIIFMILYFPFTNALMSESKGFLIFKERLIRFFFGCILLIVCISAFKESLMQLETAGIDFPDFLISSIILNTNSETTVPLIN